MQNVDKRLHIICLDIPYPADYGGVFDLFYKIKALHAAGIGIHLHCFEYGRKRRAELNQYCETVEYYPRNTGISGLSLNLPYIVSSRNSRKLLENLSNDHHPILAEGIHCTYLLTDQRFQHRRVVLRLHNVEYLYYQQLAKTTPSLLKKIYYSIESRLLYRYEKDIARKVAIVAVSQSDMQVYQDEFGADKIVYLPVFLPYTDVLSQEGIGSYCLYHGNLSVAENDKAATWLLREIFREVDIPFVIAGKNPSRRLVKEVSAKGNCCLVANPTEDELQDLVVKAQINVLPSFNSTGIKLKLLNALMNGRHCVVNDAASAGMPVKNVCHVANTTEQTIKLISELYNKPFDQADIDRRRTLLKNHYNTSVNTAELIRWIW